MKPTPAQVEKAKNCPHFKSYTFIDATFTGIGIACSECNKLLAWQKEPDPNAKSIYDEKNQKNILDYAKSIK